MDAAGGARVSADGSRRSTVAAPRSRPLYLRAWALALVAAGGAAGTLARYGLERAIGNPPGGFPWATFTANVTGAFLLGALLHALVLAGDDTGARRAVRLCLGTGVLGGYTTYSGFAVQTVTLAGAVPSAALPPGGPAPLLALGYDVASLACGIGAALLGAAAAHRWGRRS